MPENSQTTDQLVHGGLEMEGEGDDTEESDTEEFVKERVLYEDEALKIYRQKTHFIKNEKFRYSDHKFDISATLKDSRGHGMLPLMLISLHAIVSALKSIIEELRQAYTGRIDRWYYLCFTQKDLTSGRPMGPFLLFHTKISDVANYFKANLQSLLQSYKKMPLDSNFTVILTILGKFRLFLFFVAFSISFIGFFSKIFRFAVYSYERMYTSFGIFYIQVGRFFEAQLEGKKY